MTETKQVNEKKTFIVFEQGKGLSLSRIFFPLTNPNPDRYLVESDSWILWQDSVTHLYSFFLIDDRLNSDGEIKEEKG